MIRRTYFFRRYTNRPRIFVDWWIPSVWNNNEVEVINWNNDDFFINWNYVDDNNISTYTINSHKQVRRAKLFTRSPDWTYLVPDFFQENIIKFFILNGIWNFRNCYISSTTEWLKHLITQASNTNLDSNYLPLQNTTINLSNIINRFAPINLIWIGFSIEWNANLKSMKLKASQGVTESEEAQQVIRDWWIIKYIEFSEGDTNITIYEDFRFSFYSEWDNEADITLINSIIDRYTLLS